jgi:predicted aspartyl protease
MRAAPLLLAATLTACAGETGPCKLGIAADLPVTTSERAFFTSIGINNGTARVRVDTGSANNLLSASTATRLGMAQQMLMGAMVRGVGGARPVNLAVSDRVTLGGAHGNHIAFITAEDSTFPPGTDGLLGMDFLSQYDDDLDFQAGHLRLVRARGDCARANTPLPPPLYAVKFRTLGTAGPPIIDVVINGIKLSAVIDTGATLSLLFRPAAERLGLPVTSMLAGGGRRINGIGSGSTRAAFGILHEPVTIGALEISNLPMTIADQDSGAGVDMLLGYDFAKTVHLWISHSSQTVLMQYPAQPTPLAR